MTFQNAINDTQIARIVIRSYTTSSTWTKPRNLKFVMIECIGGGGSSGGCPAASGSQIGVSGASGAGAYARAIINADLMSATHTVTVGAGGTAPGPGGNGSNGGDSSVNTPFVLSAEGGFGSFAGTVGSGVVTVTGRPGGNAGSGPATGLWQSGNTGANSSGFLTSPFFFTATGAVPGMFGSFGAGAPSVQVQPGQSAQSGLAGGGGLVIITEFLGGS